MPDYWERDELLKLKEQAEESGIRAAEAGRPRKCNYSMLVLAAVWYNAFDKIAEKRSNGEIPK